MCLFLYTRRSRTALAALVLAALGALLYVRYGRPSLVESVRVEHVT